MENDGLLGYTIRFPGEIEEENLQEDSAYSGNVNDLTAGDGSKRDSAGDSDGIDPTAGDGIEQNILYLKEILESLEVLIRDLKVVKSDLDALKLVPKTLDELLLMQNELLKTVKELRTKPVVEMVESAIKKSLDGPIAKSLVEDIARTIVTNMLARTGM